MMVFKSFTATGLMHRQTQALLTSSSAGAVDQKGALPGKHELEDGWPESIRSARRQLASTSVALPAICL